MPFLVTIPKARTCLTFVKALGYDIFKCIGLYKIWIFFSVYFDKMSIGICTALHIRDVSLRTYFTVLIFKVEKTRTVQSSINL